MHRLLIIYIMAAALGVLVINEASARGRSFPIEITGTIVSFDRANQDFKIRVDQSAGILTIGVGRDCKFKLSGATATERIIRPHAHVKVSYFATIFTGNIAVEIELQPTASNTGRISTSNYPK